VTVFVSYARRDNPPDALKVIEKALLGFGDVYIDDLHGLLAADRGAAVESALEQASVLIAVVTPYYRDTAWTRREFACALERKIPIIALLPDGRLVHRGDVDWPWNGAEAESVRWSLRESRGMPYVQLQILRGHGRFRVERSDQEWYHTHSLFGMSLSLNHLSPTSSTTGANAARAAPVILDAAINEGETYTYGAAILPPIV
jgi:TIR domain